MTTTYELPPGVVKTWHHAASIVYSGMEVGNVDRRFGDMETVLANQAKLVSPLNADKYIVQMPQGGSDFLDLSDIPVDELEDEYPTDGLFIDKPDIALGLNPADCIAMALYVKGSPHLAVIHAGRHGVSGGIHEAAVEHMADTHGVEKQDMHAFFSPYIGPDSYYFPEGLLPEQLADPKWRKFIDRRSGNHHVDVAARIIKDLAEIGFEPTNVQMADVDVGAENSGYFSHARAGRTGEPKGRNGFAAMIRDVYL